MQAPRLCTCPKAHRGSGGIALFFLDHSTRKGWGFSITPQPLFAPGKDLVPILQEAGWALGSVWTGMENLASTGFWSPDRPACSQSLYWLCYPAHAAQHRSLLKLYYYKHWMLLCVCSAAGFTCANIMLQSACIHYSQLRVVLLFRSCSRDMLSQCCKNLRPLLTAGRCVVQRDLSLKPY